MGLHHFHGGLKLVVLVLCGVITIGGNGLSSHAQQPLGLNLSVSSSTLLAREQQIGQVIWRSNWGTDELPIFSDWISPMAAVFDCDLDTPGGAVIAPVGIVFFGQHRSNAAIEIDDEIQFLPSLTDGNDELTKFAGRITSAWLSADGSLVFGGYCHDESCEDQSVVWFPDVAQSPVRLSELDLANEQIKFPHLFLSESDDGSRHLVAIEYSTTGEPIFVSEHFDASIHQMITTFSDANQILKTAIGTFAGLVFVDEQWVAAISGPETDWLLRISDGANIALPDLLGTPASFAARNSLVSDEKAFGTLVQVGEKSMLSMHPVSDFDGLQLPELVDISIDTTGNGKFNRTFKSVQKADFSTIFRRPGQFTITAVASFNGQEIDRTTQTITVLPSPRSARRKGLSKRSKTDSSASPLNDNGGQRTVDESILNERAFQALNETTAIQILAAGETNDETIQLLIDGVVVQTWNNLGGNSNIGQFETLTYSATSAITPDQIRIAFTNDEYNPAINYDRNVRIDAIILNGVRYETEGPLVYSTGTWKPADGIVPGFRESEYLHSNGYFQYANVSSLIQVRARGDEGGEQFEIHLDGTAVATFTTTTNFQTFSYTASTPVEPSRIRIVFINDSYDPAAGIDANLQVDHLVVDGQVFETEAPTVYSTGTWRPGVGNTPGFWQSEYLHTNGYFQYVLPPASGEFSLAENVIRVSEYRDSVDIRVIRRGSASGIATLDYRTVESSAIDGEDFIGVAGSLTFADGETEKFVTVSIIDNQFVDGDRQFVFTIDNVSGNGSLVPPRTANIVIEDDDRIRGEGTGLLGEYFDDLNFTNRFITRIDPTINFNWGNGSPATGMATDNFTVSWTGRVEPLYTENYTFQVRVDDGVRLWVNNQLIIDRWFDQSPTTLSGTISLRSGGLYDIRMEYDERSGGAVAELSWQSPSQPLQIIPQSQLYAAEPPPVTPGDQLQTQVLITGLVQPTTIAFSPNDSSLMYIGEQRGIVRVVYNGQLETAPFLDFRDRVNGVRDRGLIDIAVHPDFPAIPYLYLLYTYDPPQVYQQSVGSLAGPDGRGNRAGRLTRVTADASTNYRTIVPNSEAVVIGANSTWQNFNAFANSTSNFSEPPAGILSDETNVQDFIATDSESHSVGAIVFGADGSMFVSIGDGTSYNQVDWRTRRVQDINNLSGKVLRVDPITGQGFPSNPFYDGNPNSNRSKVYLLGLRNPFRMAINRETNRLFIGDVGWGQWEEINAADAGANLGWPWYEGGNGVNLQTNGYKTLADAIAFYNSGQVVTPAIYALNHSTGINAIVLGDVYSGNSFPEEYRGNLFFNDLGRGIVSRIRFDASGTINSVGTFATGHRMVVKIRQGPDGNLYYVDLDDGQVGRWRFID